MSGLKLITLEGCHFCTLAKDRYRDLIESGQIEVVPLEDALKRFDRDGLKRCLLNENGLALPDFVIVDGAKVVDCARVEDTEKVLRLAAGGTAEEDTENPDN